MKTKLGSYRMLQKQALKLLQHGIRKNVFGSSCKINDFLIYTCWKDAENKYPTHAAEIN